MNTIIHIKLDLYKVGQNVYSYHYLFFYLKLTPDSKASNSSSNSRSTFFSFTFIRSLISLSLFISNLLTSSKYVILGAEIQLKSYEGNNDINRNVTFSSFVVKNMLFCSEGILNLVSFVEGIKLRFLLLAQTSSFP